jgi:hypothetical protein
MPTRERESFAQSPETRRSEQKPEMSSPALATMTETQWELYRLNVVKEWQESPHKAAVIGAIKHKLMILALQERTSIVIPNAPTPTAKTKNGHAVNASLENSSGSPAFHSPPRNNSAVK